MDISLEEFDSAPTKEHHLGKITNFSDEGSQNPGELTRVFRYMIGDSRHGVGDGLWLYIYANGKSIENKGYVSIFVKLHDFSFSPHLPEQSELVCILSVIDVTGRHRFSQSLRIHGTWFRVLERVSLGFERFVSRETIISEKSDLLPDDTLTIHLYCETLMHMLERPFPEEESAFDRSFEEIRGHPGERRGKLFLDSTLVQTLSRASRYFERLAATPMKEEQDGFMEITFLEFSCLRNLGMVIMGGGCLSLNVYDVIKMYKVARNYGIHIGLGKCREFMKKILPVENIPEIFEIAQAFDDSDLMEIVDDILSTNYTGETEAGIQILCMASKKYILRVDGSLEEMDYDERPAFDFYN